MVSFTLLSLSLGVNINYSDQADRVVAVYSSQKSFYLSPVVDSGFHQPHQLHIYLEIPYLASANPYLSRIMKNIHYNIHPWAEWLQWSSIEQFPVNCDAVPLVIVKSARVIVLQLDTSLSQIKN